MTFTLEQLFKSAIVNENIRFMITLLKDSRVDPRDNNNYAIRHAAEYGYFKIVKRLLTDPRVDPSDRNNYAIRWAADNGHQDVVKLLLKDSTRGSANNNCTTSR